MAHPWHHAVSSARKYGGSPEDYLEIHSWFDGSKSQMADFRHRALRHHAFGIFEAEKLFGVTIVNSAGKVVPVRFIGEQHVREDCGGTIPSVQDWLRGIPSKPWMNVGKLSGDAPDPHDEGPDLGLEAWRGAVLRGETVLGHADWMDRTMRIAAAERPENPEN
jgi:hypothetical protein